MNRFISHLIIGTSLAACLLVAPTAASASCSKAADGLWVNFNPNASFRAMFVDLECPTSVPSPPMGQDGECMTLNNDYEPECDSQNLSRVKAWYCPAGPDSCAIHTFLVFVTERGTMKGTMIRMPYYNVSVELDFYNEYDLFLAKLTIAASGYDSTRYQWLKPVAPFGK